MAAVCLRQVYLSQVFPCALHQLHQIALPGGACSRLARSPAAAHDRHLPSQERSGATRGPADPLQSPRPGEQGEGEQRLIPPAAARVTFPATIGLVPEEMQRLQQIQETVKEKNCFYTSHPASNKLQEDTNTAEVFARSYYSDLEGRQDVGIAVDLITCYANILSSFLSICSKSQLSPLVWTFRSFSLLS
ncbi:mitochondrial amidoxime reducing component 2 [Platysternon megacephalum]|uniref:Mitochondrial amidoxime reducing component 2 n=1 Tax=Platysternon megacephalum TaxID=55544 RepID=A0A4D9EWY9_9SAUR|nr:mitochondrial amidoxime reducing component 2 [Platysternon megacephalum]